MNVPAVLLHRVLILHLHQHLPAAISIAVAAEVVVVASVADLAAAVPEAAADTEDNIPVINIRKSSNQYNDCCFSFFIKLPKW